MIDDEDVEHPWAYATSTSQLHTGHTTRNGCRRTGRQVRVVDDVVDEGQAQEFHHAGWMAAGTDFKSVVGDTELDDESLVGIEANETSTSGPISSATANVSVRQVPQRGI